MQISTTVVYAALMLAGLSSAVPCKKGLKYCGRGLKSMGSYDDSIGQVLLSNYINHNITSPNPDNVLFKCYGDWEHWKGLIVYDKYCNNDCVYGGQGKDDLCRP